MTQIKDSNVIKTPEVVLNPLFFIPPGVVDVRTGTGDVTDEDGSSFDDVSDLQVIDVDDAITDPDLVDGDSDGTEAPATPQWMSIIGQEVRIATDGRAVVDVVIELEDVTGASEYDIRVTK